jgi:hypothetical protein
MFPESLFPTLPVRDTLDLLAMPWAFSQTSLLTAAEFEREAKRRGVTLWNGQLEQLHRRKLLVPFFRVADRPVAQPIEFVRGHAAALSSTMLYAASTGRLVDPLHRPFRRWPRDGRHRFLYSEFQLLVARELGALASVYRGRRVDDDIAWDLPAPEVRLVDAMGRARDLAVILELLAPRYRPRIMSVIRAPNDALNEFIREIDPLARWSPIISDPDLLQRQGEMLIFEANSFDPLGKWMRVARIGRSRRWDELRFDGLLAQEFRIAAEHFLLLREDLVEVGAASALPPVSKTYHEARHDRLVVDARERAETVLDFNLGDNPAAVLALEGTSEMEIAPLLLSAMGFDERLGLVQLVNLKSVDGDVRLLARAVAVPQIDPDGYRGARVLRRLTGLVVAVDQEKQYVSDKACERVRQSIVDEIFTSLPKSVRTPTMRSQLEHLVIVRAWGPERTFEFAHFSDAELARAIRRLAGKAAPPYADLVKIVARHRAGDRDVEKIWKNWAVKPGKPQLAQALWPVLHKRVLNPRLRATVPIARAFEEAIELGLRASHARELLT